MSNVMTRRRKMTRAKMSTPEGAFALRLRQEMDAKGWQVKELQLALRAHGVEVSKSGLHKWLRGDGIPYVTTLRVLREIFGRKLVQTLV